MSALTELEIREAFHCVLLAYLPPEYRSATTGASPLRLKGGVNLRLFHGSVRYSEDIDFDLTPMRGPKFIEHLRKLLEKPGPFRGHLLKLGIQSLDLSPLEGGDGGFKQKLRLIVGGVPHHTKVEVSYGEETAPSEAEPTLVPEAFRQRYRLPTGVRVARYPGPTALWQKVLAVSRRTHPQTRDVFDIEQLWQADPQLTAAGTALIWARMRPDQVSAAAEAVLAFTPAEFAGQTAAYLPETHREDAITSWPDLQHRVWEWLAHLYDEMSAAARSTDGAADGATDGAVAGDGVGDDGGGDDGVGGDGGPPLPEAQPPAPLTADTAHPPESLRRVYGDD